MSRALPLVVALVAAPNGCLGLSCPGSADHDARPRKVAREDVAEDIEEPPMGACPSDELVRRMHAAAYYFEHDQAKRALAELDEAKSVLPPLAEPTTGKIWSTLLQIPEAKTPDAARLLAEEVRAALTDWHCLPEAMHEALHAELHDDSPSPE